MMAYRDVRSKGEIGIERAQGSIRVDCKVRSLIISNAPGGKQINTFEDGGSGVINGLHFEHPDVVRFDYACLVEARPFLSKNNNKGILEPFDKKDYRNRLQWIWTRKEENIIISEKIANLVTDKGIKLSQKYHAQEFPLIGLKIDEKLMKISTAIAATLCSTKDFINLIVLEEHVEMAVSFLESLYGPAPFSLGDFVKKQEQFTADAVTAEDISKIFEQYGNASFEVTMEKISTKATINTDEFKFYFDGEYSKYNQFLGWMLRNNFLKIRDSKSVLITERYKEAFRKMKNSKDLIHRPKPTNLR